MYLVDGSWNAIVDSLTIYMYTGQEFDGDDVYYYGARYYDPVLGRFLQADTVLDGMNRYAYCGNNPVRYVDPTGHVEVDYANMNEAHAAEEAAEMAAEEARSREKKNNTNSGIDSSGNGNSSGESMNGDDAYEPCATPNPIIPPPPPPVPSPTPNPFIDEEPGLSNTENDPGYLDINLTAGYILGFTSGLMVDANALYYYLGLCLTPPGVTITATGSANSVSTGLNVAFSGCVGVAGQIGWSPNGGIFTEGGYGLWPGASASVFYVWKVKSW